jgi:hypothetical protein
MDKSQNILAATIYNGYRVIENIVTLTLSRLESMPNAPTYKMKKMIKKKSLDICVK